MGLDISISKKLLLRSGATYDLGCVECPAEPKCHELWYQSECFFLADYAKDNLKRISGDESSFYGTYELPMDNILDIIKRCNQVLNTYYDKNLKKIFPMGECMKGGYNGYDDRFYRDAEFCAKTLSVTMEDFGNHDVIFEIHIG